MNPILGTPGGILDNPAAPFLTINQAITALSSLPSLGSTGFGLVQLAPGTYSTSTNGEVFPIQMQRGVHIQGDGAKQTIIRGEGTSSRANTFLPSQPTGARVPAEVLIDFSTATLLSFRDVPSIEGVTLVGGDVQVYMDAGLGGRVSNCVLDQTNGYSPLPLATATKTPSFGMLFVHPYTGNGTASTYPSYRAISMNNTIVQGYLGAGGPYLAQANNVGICDVNEYTNGQAVDPNPTLRGVGNVMVVNTLIRALPTAPRTAMLGIDASDERVGGLPTNAYLPTMNGASGFDVTGTWSSALVTGQTAPSPAVALGGIGANDVDFVGEAIQVLQGGALHIRDFRLMPSSVLRDQGQASFFGIVVANGTVLSAITVFCQQMTPFDLDGEQWGNPRGVSTAVDIGFDEIDSLISAGSLGNDSHSHDQPWAANVATGNPTRWYFSAVGNTSSVVTLCCNLPDSILLSPTYSYLYTTPAGTLTPPVFNTALNGNIYVNFTAAPPFNFFLLDPLVMAGQTWINPVNGSPRSVSGFSMLLPQPAGTPGLLNQQAVYVNNLGASQISNLQREVL